MSFQHGLSGINAASTNLDVIGNNIANANTAGFKQSQAQFSDIFANSLEGSDSAQVGIGAKISTILQQFGQGNITPTSNPLDIAISGQGFFRVTDQGVVSYSRNGQFHVNDEGFIVDASGAFLTGYTADESGAVITNDQPSRLKFDTADLPPKATEKVDMGFNLNATSGEITAAFNANNPNTISYSTAGTVYDSLGNSHLLSVFFQKTPAVNTWNVYATVDGKVDSPATGVPVGITLGTASPQTLEFDDFGKLIAPTTPLSLEINFDVISPDLGVKSPQIVNLDLTTTTQYGASNSIHKNQQDGYTSGRMSGFSVGDDGSIQANYSSGKSKLLGQIVLANFVNPQGLVPIGDGHWVESSASGEPIVGIPKTGGLGLLQSNAIEDSNVDLTAELVKMIAAQRMYQASAKTIETQDQIIQTITNI